MSDISLERCATDARARTLSRIEGLDRALRSYLPTDSNKLHSQSTTNHCICRPDIESRFLVKQIDTKYVYSRLKRETNEGMRREAE